MYKVMIVDDEMLIRMGYQSIVNWEECGYELCGFFENGEAALTAFEELHSDLVLTDTRMPLCDGIELIRQIKKRSPETICIILSAYGDIEYVKEGIKAGAEDYLLKLDLTKETLEALLLKMRDKLRSNGREEEQNALLKGQKKTETLLSRWFSGAEVEQEDVWKCLKLYQIYPSAAGWICMNIHLCLKSDLSSAKMKNSIGRQIISQTLQSAGRWVVVEMEPGEFCALGRVDKDIMQYAERVKQSILLTLKSVLNLSNVTTEWATTEEIMTVPKIFEKLLQSKTIHTNKENENTMQQYSPVVRKALLYIQQHFVEELSLTDVAEYCRVSPAYLSRNFSKEYGMGFQEYLMELRVKKSVCLLKNTDLKIYEVARQTGYPDAVYFNKMFKKNLGMTPKEYREQEKTIKQEKTRNSDNEVQ